MNRAERRRLQKKENKKEPVYNISQQNIDKIKQNAKSEALNTAFCLMVCLPIMVVHDHFTDLWKKEVDGKCREERALDYILDLYDSFEKGYLTLNDIIETVEKETGQTLEFIEKRTGRSLIK